MPTTELLLESKVHYYCRERFYRHMLNATLEGLKLFPGDPVYTFYYGVSLLLEERIQEGMRELDNIQNVPDVMLGCILALIYGHRRCKTIDKEAVARLDAQLKENRKQCGEKGLFYGGMFLMFINRYEKAREYIDRMIKVAPNWKEGILLKGWLDVMGVGKDAAKTALHFFESVSSNEPELLFGRAKCAEKLQNFSKGVDILNQAVVLYPRYHPALIEKMKLQLTIQDWEQTVDCANRILHEDRQNIEALRHLVLNALCLDGDYVVAATVLTELVHALEICEPNNHFLHYETAQVFSRVCGRRPAILLLTFSLAEKAAALDPGNAEYSTELGYQCLLQGKVREGSKFYNAATKKDEGSMTALMGVIFCQLLDGQLEVAGQQLELLKEIHKSSGMSLDLLFLNGLHAQKTNKRPDEVIGYLNESVDKHFAQFSDLPLGLKYYLLLNPDFLLLICRLYLHFVPDQPILQGQSLPPALKRSQTILQPVTKACPGLVEAAFVMAKLKYLSGKTSAAESILQRCLQQDESFSEARLLLSQIQLHQGNIESANQTLEMALSYSFEVRDKVQFHLMKGKIQKGQGELQEAVKSLKTGMALAGLIPSSASQKRNKQEITTDEKVSIYLELSDVYRRLNMQHEAAKIMQDALNDFHGSPEEVRIVIANADLALARGDTDLALGMLRNITPEQSYYIQAREKMADIYLNYRKDRRLYASCYREVVEKHPTPQAYLLLGDAYMSIQEPERAIEVYEQALKKNPRDFMLGRKIGQALVKTHQYDKAVTYYKSAIKTGGQSELKYDLAELLYRMRRFKDADEIINQSLQGDNQGSDLVQLQWQAKFLLLQSNLHKKLDSDLLSLQILQRAREAQSRVMRRVFVEQPDAIQDQKKLAVSICTQLAERSTAKKEIGQASQYYREALSYDDNNNEIMLALAKLELGINNVESAKQHCANILKLDADNNAATLMMADIMFRKNDLESAMFHFQNLLDRKPNYYQGLARYIEAVRRLGKLEEVSKYLEKLEGLSHSAALETGYYYCKGLYEWYTSNTNGAMKSFNQARNDSEWGLIATFHMIEICVNPDNETMGGETFVSLNQENGSNNQVDFKESAIRTAEKLLSDIRSKIGSDIDYRIMTDFVLLARKNKSDAEKALSDFVQIASMDRYRDHVGAILGMATAYMILKHTPKARNQLKRVAKIPWNLENAEYLEKCWLLLADIYIQSGKFDMGTELLKRVLQHNKSCTKAYEYTGFIMEKEQSYKDAAINYEIAWKQSNQSNPVIGYKLAFNYMKAKRYVDAITVCHVVLGKYPTYPKIRKEIFEKSRSNLRM